MDAVSSTKCTPSSPWPPDNDLAHGKVARQSADSLMREAALCPGILRPASDRFVRKVGRPRLDGITEVGKTATQAAGGLQRLENTIRSASEWHIVVDVYRQQYE